MKYDLAKLMYRNLSDIKKISSDRIDKVKKEYRERSKKLDERKRLYEMSGDSFNPPIYDDEHLEKIKGLMGSGYENQALSLSESMGLDPLSKDVKIFDDHLEEIEEDIESSKDKIKGSGFEVSLPSGQRRYGENPYLERIELVLRKRLGVSASVADLDIDWSGTWTAEVSLRFPFHGELYSGTAELQTGGVRDGEIALVLSNSSSNMDTEIKLKAKSNELVANLTVSSKDKWMNRKFLHQFDSPKAPNAYGLFFDGLDAIKPFIWRDRVQVWLFRPARVDFRTTILYNKKDITPIGKVIGIILSRFNEVISGDASKDEDEVYELIERGNDLMKEFYLFYYKG